MGSLQTNAKFSCSIQNIDYERIWVNEYQFNPFIYKLLILVAFF
jgi:hypothetical protein